MFSKIRRVRICGAWRSGNDFTSTLQQVGNLVVSSAEVASELEFVHFNRNVPIGFGAISFALENQQNDYFVVSKNI